MLLLVGQSIQQQPLNMHESTVAYDEKCGADASVAWLIIILSSQFVISVCLVRTNRRWIGMPVLRGF